jgi:hypothetical protein
MVLLRKAEGSGRVSEADVALRDARTVGRHGYPHRRRPSLRNGFPGKVGKDKAPDNVELSRMVEQDFLQRLLVIRGFLIYVDRTYPWLSPYIKGLHLTIDSWRPGREESGFKMRGKELERALAAWAEGRGLPCRQEDDDTDGVAPPSP